LFFFGSGIVIITTDRTGSLILKMTFLGAKLDITPSLIAAD